MPKSLRPRLYTPSSNPKYLKPSQIPEYYPIFGRSQVWNHIREGTFKSKLLRRPGNISGTRIVLVESIEAFIQNSPDK